MIKLRSLYNEIKLIQPNSGRNINNYDDLLKFLNENKNLFYDLLLNYEIKNSDNDNAKILNKLKSEKNYGDFRMSSSNDSITGTVGEHKPEMYDLFMLISLKPFNKKTFGDIFKFNFLGLDLYIINNLIDPFMDQEEN